MAFSNVCFIIIIYLAYGSYLSWKIVCKSETVLILICTHTQMAKKYMAKCPTSVIIRELLIRTTVRCYLPPVRMTIIKKTSNDKCWWGCGLFLRTIWSILKKRKNTITIWPAILLLGIWGNKIVCQRILALPYLLQHFSE
jgi:hypothetical protein